jgi:DNA-binding MarR family transcriptional regulator
MWEMHAILTRADRLDRAMTMIGRRGTLTRFHRAVMRACGSEVDRAVYLVLRRLNADGPARITDLADGMAVEPSTISRHVHMLERKGWLVKSADPSDGRVAVAAVTEEGRALVEAMEAERRRILDRTLARWSDADLDRFVALFERFADDLADTLDDLDL